MHRPLNRFDKCLIEKPESMSTEHTHVVWGTSWAWVVAALTAAVAIQLSLTPFIYHKSLIPFITCFLIVLATSFVYGPLVFGWAHVLEPQSYHPVDIVDGHGVQEERLQQTPQCATEDAGAGAGADPNTPMETEGADLELERQNKSGSFEQFQSQDRPQRLHFLDNVKTFLTALVVSHHVTCAFGGCGRYWFLVVGDYPCAFHSFAKGFTLLNQAYFMSLFFFISSYFTPSSYDRKGRTAFLLDKGRRLWIPAMVTSFTIVPACILIGKVTMGAAPVFVPHPGHCWFLFWLLALNYAYCVIRNGDSDSDTATTVAPGSSEASTQFPTFLRRFLYGALICGLATYALTVVIDSKFFYGMPLTVGSLTSDLLLFAVGVVAKRNRWLSRPIEEQMDTPVWYLRVGVLLEAVILLAIASTFSNGILFFLVAGVLCLDMSVAVLQLFQRHINFQTPTSRFLADSAYTVYLVHPTVITGATSVYIWVYNSLCDGSITFKEGRATAVSESHLEGPYDGGFHLFFGWLVVMVVSHAIVWPLAWGLRQLPGLREVL